MEANSAGHVSHLLISLTISAPTSTRTTVAKQLLSSGLTERKQRGRFGFQTIRLASDDYKQREFEKVVDQLTHHLVTAGVDYEYVKSNDLTGELYVSMPSQDSNLAICIPHYQLTQLAALRISLRIDAIL